MSAPSALLDSLTLTTDPSAATRWLRSWFGDRDELVALTLLRDVGAASIAHNETLTLGHLLDAVERRGLLEAATFDGGHEWNLYASLGTYLQRPEQRNGRAHKALVGYLPGMWVDLDVKEGGFASQDHALSLLRALPREGWPTSVVATGTGGVHGYWNLAGAGELGPAGVADLCERWWAHLSALAGPGVHVDRLTEVGRVTKLPGTIRWPKGREASRGIGPTPVKLLYAEEDAARRRLLDPAWVEKVTAGAWAVEQDLRAADVERRRERQRAAAALLPRDASGWTISYLHSLAGLEEAVTETLTWEDVLEPAGWTRVGSDSEERQIWSRPGGEGRKSASTDYRGSTVMTLFSDAPDTGLRELVEVGATLTRYAVLVELWYGGNEAALVAAWNDAGGNVGALTYQTRERATA